MARRRPRDTSATDRRAAARRAEVEAGANRHHSMTTDDIEAGMRRLIRQKLVAGEETITVEEFKRAGLPEKEVEPRFKRVLSAVQNDLAMERG